MPKKKDTPRWLTWFLLAMIVVFAIWVKSIRLTERYGFDWDQSDDATKVMTMFWEKKPALIGPRVASDNGFFVGPYHYYFLAPFYLATGGNPLAGAYAVMVVSIVTILITYYVARELYGETTGFAAALLTASFPSLTSWNAMHIVPVAILGYYFCVRLLTSNRLFLPAVALASLAAGLHLVPASLLAYLILAVLLSTEKPTARQVWIGLLIFLLSLTPLIVFDLRHQFINSNKFIEFLTTGGSTIKQDTWYFSRILWKSLSITGSLTFMSALLIEKIIVLISFVYALVKQKNIRVSIFTFLWILSPILLMSQYHGNIPEYYYGFITSLIVIFVVRLFVETLPLWLTGIILFFLIQGQVHRANIEMATIPLRDKLNVVTYIATQTNFPVYNVSYNLPLGYNTGYQYLFKYLKREPVSGPEGHLYSIALKSNEKEKFVYTSGLLGVIQR